MRITDSRIEDGRLVLKGDGREFSLPDGVFRLPTGESMTILHSKIVAALPPIDFESATRRDLKLYIKDLEEQLSTIGDDARLANIDLQNMLQKQQQTIEMMSNISKVLHDTALAVIRKIG
jgi:hypothetical protein